MGPPGTAFTAMHFQEYYENMILKSNKFPWFPRITWDFTTSRHGAIPDGKGQPGDQKPLTQDC